MKYKKFSLSVGDRVKIKITGEEDFISQCTSDSGEVQYATINQAWFARKELILLEDATGRSVRYVLKHVDEGEYEV
jgi:hypothetical protein